ncbi:hypothetical protein SAMN06265379_101944 [Saccharicrinis carchari]|uniref:Uncharacterized protein n=1 Tax=Saccharicrinis carchari TaxID=1168039 RepID=A0A521BHJ4_SACCC|nr:hypothetical protein [Saccharicrinis carchari]SMO46617.1 hypothetical protein SAMN06265379_101944 [Saccharicrinis carchari]
MEKRLINKFNMYKVVRDWLSNNQASFEYLPGFTATFEEFSAMLDTIADLDKDKATSSGGYAKTKAEARALLERQMMEMIRILKVYATFNNDQLMLNDIDFTESQLVRSSEQLLLVRSKKTIEHAEAVQAEAESYGLTADRLEALRTASRNFDEKQTTVRNAIVNRKDSGEQLEARMDEADDLLKGKIDLLMELSQNMLPELYNQYKASRIIVDR